MFPHSKNPFRKILVTPSITYHQQDVYFQSSAADCALGDLITREKLTLQGLILQPCELSQSENLIIGAGASLMHSIDPKRSSGVSAAPSLLKVFDCSNLLHLLVIAHQAVYKPPNLYMMESTA